MIEDEFREFQEDMHHRQLDEEEETFVKSNDSEIIRETLRLYGSLYLCSMFLYTIVRRIKPHLFNLRSWVPKMKCDLAQKEYGVFSWFWEVYKVEDQEIFEQCGMDAMCFLRALRFGRRLSAMGCFNAIWLIPLYVTAKDSPETAMLEDPFVLISIANLPSQSRRFIGTVIASYITYLYTMYLVIKEFEWYTYYRHKFLSQKKAQNYVVYVSGIPEDYRSSYKLVDYFRHCAGHDAVVEAHVAMDTPKLDQKVARREVLVRQLEHFVHLEQKTGETHQHRRVYLKRGVQKVDTVAALENELRELNRDIKRSVQEFMNANDQFRSQLKRHEPNYRNLMLNIDWGSDESNEYEVKDEDGSLQDEEEHVENESARRELKRIQSNTSSITNDSGLNSWNVSNGTGFAEKSVGFVDELPEIPEVDMSFENEQRKSLVSQQGSLLPEEEKLKIESGSTESITADEMEEAKNVVAELAGTLDGSVIHHDSEQSKPENNTDDDHDSKHQKRNSFSQSYHRQRPSLIDDFHTVRKLTGDFDELNRMQKYSEEAQPVAVAVPVGSTIAKAQSSLSDSQSTFDVEGTGDMAIADYSASCDSRTDDIVIADYSASCDSKASKTGSFSSRSSKASVRRLTDSSARFVVSGGRKIRHGVSTASSSIATGSRAATRTVNNITKKTGDKIKQVSKDLNADKLLESAGAQATKMGQQLGTSLVTTAGAVVPILLVGSEGEPKDSGFVVFSNLYATQSVLQMIHHPEPYAMNVTPAPQPADIFWRNVGLPHQSQRSGHAAAIAASAVLCFFWSIPMAFISSLTELNSLRESVPKLGAWIDDRPYMEMVFAQLAPMALLFFNEVLLPSTLKYFAAWEGHISSAMLEASLFVKMGFFQIIQTFFISAISGGVSAEISNFIERPESIIDLLANSLPAQSSYFIQFALASTFFLQSIEMLRLYPLTLALMRRFIGPKLTPKERQRTWGWLNSLEDPPEFWHAETFAQLILFYMVALVYQTIAPVTAFFLGFCFILIESGYRYQFFHNYPRAFDTGGRIWRYWMRFTLSSMVVAQLTLIGLLSLKQNPYAGPALGPLMAITLLFIAFVNSKHSMVCEHLPTRECVTVDSERNAEGQMNMDFVKQKYLQPSLQTKVVEPDYDEGEDYYPPAKSRKSR